MNILEVQKTLKLQGLNTAIYYNEGEDMHYIDLNTMAKSHLYLYEDFTLKGRYGYSATIAHENVIPQLCHHFLNCFHGRSYCNPEWEEICSSLNIKIDKSQFHV